MGRLPARARGLAAGLAGALILGAAPLPAPPPAAPTLCHAGEPALFSCPLGHKTVSVCGGPGPATYRFGRPGAVEMQARGARFASRGESGGGESQITLMRAGYTYVVYDRTVRTGFGADGRNDPDFEAGLAVVAAGRTVSHAACRTDATVAAAARALPAGPFVDHR